MKWYHFLLSILYIYLFTSCSPVYTKYISNYQTLRTDSAPNYSNLNYWAAHPGKKDPSDSVPKPFRNSYKFDSAVDVFFLYPTSLTDKKDKRWNADIDDAAINAKTDYNSILYQASAFNEYRLFAPRYRQAHYRSYFAYDTTAALKAFELAYQDVKTAFQFYLDHFNKGRPIIIASHSQGSTHAIRLLKEFFDDGPLKQKLVAAYLVGMYLPENYYANLKICTDSSQINCFCAWRTYQVNYIPPFVQKEKVKSSVTNPISWTTNTEFVSPVMNKGAILRNFNRLYPHVAGAQIKDGILWTPKPKFPGSFLFRTKNYHVGDINLFYSNIRYNIRQRVAAYTKK